MSPTIAGRRTWEAAAAPGPILLAKKYESALRSESSSRPALQDFLPQDSSDRTAVLLVLLRVELSSEFQKSPGFRVETLRDRFPEVAGESLVALLYEEFCLREEAGEKVNPGEYQERFPEESAALVRVLEIHDLVGAVSSTSGLLEGSLTSDAEGGFGYPEAGQTIDGFRLVEELGRGSFARVFRAEERQLADRPVALKLARRGSREPQLLAGLQHTYIVPVHSYRIDRSTGLHLMCMPYYGRVTLGRLLADPEIPAARDGKELMKILDRLGEQDATAGWSECSRARQTLEQLGFTEAIAWWGARLAEALQHAHDRGVLHRDLKPSNILLTLDGLPMLLDFNLARGPWIDSGNPAGSPTLGGTLAYMAPEELDDLSKGVTDRIDPRGDIYSLGVVLYETLVGERPFHMPKGCGDMIETFQHAATERRREVPRLCEAYPEVSRALETVVRRCLAPDPLDRYQAAGELAADLQAVADDLPLRFARVPIQTRAFGWVRRHRRAIAMCAPVLVIVALGLQIQRERRLAIQEYDQHVARGETRIESEQYGVAFGEFDVAEKIAARHSLGLDRQVRAAQLAAGARQARGANARVVAFLAVLETLKFRLLDHDGDRLRAGDEAQIEIDKLLNGATICTNSLGDLALLKRATLEDLLLRLGDLEFLRAVTLAEPREYEQTQRAVATCDRALCYSIRRQPWDALRSYLASEMETGKGSLPATDDDPAREGSARVCFQWALLRHLQGRRDASVAWLDRAHAINESDFWSNYYLANIYRQQGWYPQALTCFGVAIALRPSSQWPRFGRGGLYYEHGRLAEAVKDLEQGIELAGSPAPASFRFDLASAFQALGDFGRARAIYDDLISRSDLDVRYPRGSMVNLAKLEYDSGRPLAARKLYAALLDQDPNDVQVGLGMALLNMHTGQLEQCERILNQLVERDPQDADLLGNRALARLLMGRLGEADADAEAALQLKPGPLQARLRFRIALARGAFDQLRIDDASVLARLPAGGARLQRDIRTTLSSASPPTTLQAWITRAVLLQAIGSLDDLSAVDEAVRIAPNSIRPRLLRASIHRQRGARRRAREDLEFAQQLEPDDPRVRQLKGRLNRDEGNMRAALIDFTESIAIRAGASALADRGSLLTQLGEPARALDDWSKYIALEPDDPLGHVNRAEILLKLGRFDEGSADLEIALNWSSTDPLTLLRISCLYLRVLPEHPDRIGRVCHALGSTWAALKAEICVGRRGKLPNSSRIGS